MATTNASPVVVTTSSLVGSTVTSAPIAMMVNGTGAANNVGGVGNELANGFGGNAVRIDGFASDFSKDGYAANGCFAQTLTTSGTATIDFTNVSAAATSQAGDNLATLLNKLIINNYGTVDITVAPGASNPIGSIFAGTSPTLRVPAGSKCRLESVAGWTISSTSKTLLFTNTSGSTAAAFGVGYGGA